MASQLRGAGWRELEDKLFEDITIYLDIFHRMLLSYIRPTCTCTKSCTQVGMLELFKDHSS